MIVHASTVVLDGRAALIRGASGAGKSSLALQLMALGAGLIADDRTALWREGRAVFAKPAPHISGLIEARGIGVLSVPMAPPAPLVCVIDLDHAETERVPQRSTMLLDVALPLLHKVDSPAWPAAIRAYLASGIAKR